MDGITIIEEHLCRQLSLQRFISIGFFITLLCVGTLFLYRFMWSTSTKTKSDKIVYLTSSTLIIGALIMFWCVQTNTYSTTHMEYTVTVDDTVGFNEFHEKYEIITQNGEEYRVKKIE